MTLKSWAAQPQLFHHLPSTYKWLSLGARVEDALGRHERARRDGSAEGLRRRGPVAKRHGDLFPGDLGSSRSWDHASRWAGFRCSSYVSPFTSLYIYNIYLLCMQYAHIYIYINHHHIILNR